MAPRHRNKGNKGLPDNLYLNGKYYKYRNPRTGTFHGMGTDRRQAIGDAKRLNAVLQSKASSNMAQVLRAESGTMAHIIARFREEYMPTKGWGPRTVSDANFRLNRIDREIGGWPLAAVSVRQVAEYLDQFSNNAYLKFRNQLIDLFQFAIAKGMIEGVNPAKETLAKRELARKRLPLTIEDYTAIHALAPPWLQVAMELLFITLQRPVDLVQIKYADIEDGFLYVQQRKVARHDNWQSNLRIKVQGRLEQTLKLSRSDRLVSPYVIHKRPLRKVATRKGCDHWTQLQENYVGRCFADIRDTLPQFRDMPKELRPPFYEIKALGGHHYIEHYGWTQEQVSALMGHTNVKMTKVYTDRHIQWSEVAVE